ncbi:MAG TPA: universal stress protein [Candidatus Sulfomarinibacteraceae bacterium]|nr:universal stress protein [Candidatus Sulfomarinibacteraceae bacterium]
MFDRVLVALDRSEQTEDILSHVKTVACAFASHIDLVHVFDRGTRDSAVDPLDWYMERGKAQAHLSYIHKQLLDSRLPADPVLLDGSAPERILAYAEESAASLIVINHGAHKRLAGRVARKVASRARQSLLVLRDGPAGRSKREGPGAYRRILVPLDGSRRAEHVLPAATALAQQCKATLVLARVVTPPQQIRPRGTLEAPASERAAAQIMTRNCREAHAYLEQVRSHLPVPAETRLISGDPIAGLRQLSHEEEADLVLLSAHGYGCRKQQPYGRVASTFLYEGDTSLLLLQDVPGHEIGMSPAERAALATGQQAARRHNTAPTISFQ